MALSCQVPGVPSLAWPLPPLGYHLHLPVLNKRSFSATGAPSSSTLPAAWEILQQTRRPKAYPASKVEQKVIMTVIKPGRSSPCQIGHGAKNRSWSRSSMQLRVLTLLCCFIEHSSSISKERNTSLAHQPVRSDHLFLLNLEAGRLCCASEIWWKAASSCTPW